MNHQPSVSNLRHKNPCYLSDLENLLSYTTYIYYLSIQSNSISVKILHTITLKHNHKINLNEKSKNCHVKCIEIKNPSNFLF